MPRRHRSHSTEFKRQVVAEYHAGETLHALGRRHDLSRNLIRIWIEKAEAGALDEDAAAAELLGPEAELRLVISSHRTTRFHSAPGAVAIPRSAAPCPEQRSFATLRQAAFCIAVAETIREEELPPEAEDQRADEAP